MKQSIFVSPIVRVNGGGRYPVNAVGRLGLIAAGRKSVCENSKHAPSAANSQGRVPANCVFSGLRRAPSKKYYVAAVTAFRELSGHGFSHAEKRQKYRGFSR